MESSHTYLSGGIFFVLLTETKIKSSSRKQLGKDKKDKTSNRNMLESLIQIFFPSFLQPSFGRTFEGDTTDYRSCKVSNGVNLPFDDDIEITNFNQRISTQYLLLLEKMDNFIRDYLNTASDEKMRWLIQSLLTLIQTDELIRPETLLYVGSTPITKSELLACDHYCLSTLLLGIWHFIVVNRSDNKKGRLTFEALHTRSEEKNAKWRFTSNIGKTYSKEITFELFGIKNTYDIDKTIEENSQKKDSTDEAESDDDVVNTEVVDETQSSETNTLIQNGRIYQQQAEKIYNIENIENFYG